MYRWARGERRVVVTAACATYCGVNAMGRTGFPFNPSGRMPSGHLKCNMEDTRQGANNTSGAPGLRHSRRQYCVLPTPGRAVAPAKRYRLSDKGRIGGGCVSGRSRCNHKGLRGSDTNCARPHSGHLYQDCLLRGFNSLWVCAISDWQCLQCIIVSPDRLLCGSRPYYCFGPRVVAAASSSASYAAPAPTKISVA